MALHPDFPDNPHTILDPAIRWFPADETLRTTSFETLLPPLVPALRKEVQVWRDSDYEGATETSRYLLRWWFTQQHLVSQADGIAEEFRYFFAQREAVETIVYLFDVIGVKDKFDLMRFDGSGAVSSGMFDETWRRFVVKMATGAGNESLPTADDENTLDYFFGPRPTGGTTDSKVDLGMIVQNGSPETMVRGHQPGTKYRAL